MSESSSVNCIILNTVSTSLCLSFLIHKSKLAITLLGPPQWLSRRESARNSGDTGSAPRSRRSPGEENGQPTLVSSPGKSHEQKSLAGYSPRSTGSQRVGHNNHTVVYGKCRLKHLHRTCYLSRH